MANLVYSIEEVFGSYIGNRIFNIPEYQRGFKWSAQQVRQLLNDIDDFSITDDEELFYCLQNITLIQNKTNTEMLNVVDGQQRLTTTMLILVYLNETEKLKNKLNYAVRVPSNNFIQQVINERDDIMNLIFTSTDFIEFNSGIGSKDYDHQDIYFMFSALREIEKWFLKKEMKHSKIRQSFKHKLLNHVKLIINEIRENISEQELFMNLNTGRVPLDGADLVRAILITRVAKHEMEGFDQKNVKDIVRLNEKRIRIGWELDEINQWWNNKNVKEYFKPFVKIKTDKSETIEFNTEINPINILYSLWVEQGVQNAENIKLDYFEPREINVLELYNSILALHRTLKDWFEDREIYHYLGMLANIKQSKNFKFHSIMSLWVEKRATRELFIDKVKTLIRVETFGSVSLKDTSGKSGLNYWVEKIKDFDQNVKTNWYDDCPSDLENILVLLDIIELSKNKNLPFLIPTHFRKFEEDKEHIYPCTPKKVKDLDKTRPLSAIKQYLEKRKIEDHPFIITDEEWNLLEESDQEKKLIELSDFINLKTPINSIGNIVLLHFSINRGFGNDYYIDKRRSVVNNIQYGEYVRQHTLNVFVKQNNDSNDLNEWTYEDIKTNANTIAEKINDFFKEIEKDEE